MPRTQYSKILEILTDAYECKLLGINVDQGECFKEQVNIANKVIFLLHEDTRLSTAQIAQKLFACVATLRYVLMALEELGVLYRYGTTKNHGYCWELSERFQSETYLF